MIKIIPARWQLLPVQPRMGHFVTFLRLEQISAIHQLQCKVGAVNCREIQAWCKEQYREIQSTTALCSETQLSAVNIQKNAFSGPESAIIVLSLLYYLTNLCWPLYSFALRSCPLSHCCAPSRQRLNLISRQNIARNLKIHSPSYFGPIFLGKAWIIFRGRKGGGKSGPL